jgi:hypothetical protein
MAEDTPRFDPLNTPEEHMEGSPESTSSVENITTSTDPQTTEQQMPLSPEDNQKAIELQDQHRRAEQRFDTAKNDLLEVKQKNKAAQKAMDEVDLENEKGQREDPEYIPLAYGSWLIDEKPGESFDKAQDSSDLARMRAKQHVEDHLPEYIETAKQEAEADGKTINLEGEQSASPHETEPKQSESLREISAHLLERGIEVERSAHELTRSVEDYINILNDNPENWHPQSRGSEEVGLMTFDSVIDDIVFEGVERDSMGDDDYIALETFVDGKYNFRVNTKAWLNCVDGVMIILKGDTRFAETEIYVTSRKGRERTGQLGWYVTSSSRHDIIPKISTGNMLTPEDMERVSIILQHAVKNGKKRNN